METVCSEGFGSGALSERLLRLKSACPRTIQNAAAC
jgi:hypothetical protein